MRSRQHVICTRLNDKEYEVYRQILMRIRRAAIPIKNDSEAFRLALVVMRKQLDEEAMQHFYEHCLDIGVDV